MTTFEERQKGFERKFALDEELKFKATARRNRLLGLWAAGEMGIA
ncbi:MAG TPA: ATPase inhibitor subunit zeta, partial [Methyloceanibacter sp.]|nr:ATPase inhibitor subunit zeta [Methyloceanibacter sp.]